MKIGNIKIFITYSEINFELLNLKKESKIYFGYFEKNIPILYDYKF